MKYYFIVSQDGDNYVIEDLASNRQCEVFLEDSVFCNSNNGATAIITKLLPENYSLSPFKNDVGNFTFKNDNDHLLFDITGCLVNYDNSGLSQGDVVATTEWQ